MQLTLTLSQVRFRFPESSAFLRFTVSGEQAVHNGELLAPIARLRPLRARPENARAGALGPSGV
jgi:hypothetical protein